MEIVWAAIQAILLKMGNVLSINLYILRIVEYTIRIVINASNVLEDIISTKQIQNANKQILYAKTTTWSEEHA